MTEYEIFTEILRRFSCSSITEDQIGENIWYSEACIDGTWIGIQRDNEGRIINIEC